MNISQKWRLDGLLENQSPDHFSNAWLEDLNRFSSGLQSSKNLIQCIQDFQDLSERYREFSSFADCLFSENVENSYAVALTAKSVELETLLQKAQAALDHRLLKEPNLDALLQDPRLQPIAFPLAYRTGSAMEKMDLEKEALSSDLALHGYHGWHELYKQAISRMRCPIETTEVTGNFSCSQIDNLLSHPIRSVRKAAFVSLTECCKRDSTLYAQALRSIFGFRSKLYRQRSWKNPRHEALRINFIKSDTVDEMWKAVQDVSPIFHRFLDEKAKIFGLTQLSWYDFDAPYPHSTQQIPYEEGAQLIIEILSARNPEAGAFAKEVFERGWVEAENRPGKAPGGFCTPFPRSKESRIFMSYAGNMHNLLVLAHEVGHAYHNHVCFELEELAQHYPISMAESASTTFELIILDGLAERAKTKQERKWLIFEKAHRSAFFLLNIYARYLFEQELFSSMEKEFLDAEKLCQIMIQAQQHAYGMRLDEYHPYFWISKIHFYLTDIPNYNFPYTFGYLVSQAVNAKLKSEPRWFKEQYKGFLQDTGIMTVESLLEKHLGGKAFWQMAMNNALQDVEEFMSP